MDAEKTFTEVVNHSETTQEHELVVDGSNLKEKKVLDHLVRDNEEGPYQTKLVHTRWIDDDYYKVEEVSQEGEVKERRVSTSLEGDDKVEAFQQEWEAKWRPAMDEEVVAKAQAEASQADDNQE